MPAESTNEQLAKVRLEMEQLQLEDLREKMAQLKASKLQKQQSHAQIEADLQDFIRRQKEHQEYCNHRKGGRGVEGLQGRGSDANYAVVHHRFATGQIAVMCLRCQKMSFPGDEDYKAMLALPTDNEMSEAAQFRIG